MEALRLTAKTFGVMTPRLDDTAKEEFDEDSPQWM